jgi:4-oxalocrotonate tautomerase
MIDDEVDPGAPRSTIAAHLLPGACGLCRGGNSETMPGIPVHVRLSRREPGRERHAHARPGEHVPYVNVRITNDGVTAEQKATIVAEITETLRRVLGKRPEHTHIIIDEVDPENWGFAGMLTTEYRRQRAEELRPPT